MQIGANILNAGAGELFERDFIGEGEILVEREGYSRVRHIFTRNGKTIARLRWHGLRRAVYEFDGKKYDITVGALDKRIKITSPDGRGSVLLEGSHANPRADYVRVEMAEGDDFCLTRSLNSRLRAEASLSLHKAHYSSTLMVYRFELKRRTQTTVRVAVTSTMRREARFIHRLLALIVCRIIIERRHAGSQPHRVKESGAQFVSSARAREHNRVRVSGPPNRRFA
ncbi:MAG TPA: hypothetical protein VJX67_25460 [Blastocatellia bacterium]|nr:hypothetical protein [Blastocatellia bacterium]